MVASFATPYLPIKEDADADDDFSSGSYCFRWFCFGWHDDGSHRSLLHGMGEDETWLVAQIKKLKQLSEVVAGPRWKKFVRKMGRLCCCKKQAPPPFQYSLESYHTPSILPEYSMEIWGLYNYVAFKLGTVVANTSIN